MISPELARQIRYIQIRARRAVDSVFGGEYASVFRGQGIEFQEVREYQPGDEIRSIDWNVTARMGHPYVKRYVEERELTVLFLVDLSASGTFGSGARSKTEVAAEPHRPARLFRHPPPRPGRSGGVHRHHRAVHPAQEGRHPRPAPGARTAVLRPAAPRHRHRRGARLRQPRATAPRHGVSDLRLSRRRVRERAAARGEAPRPDSRLDRRSARAGAAAGRVIGAAGCGDRVTGAGGHLEPAGA